MSYPTYRVTVTRDDDLWVAVIDGVGATDVEDFADLDLEVRDYIAGMIDAAPGDFQLDWHYVQGDHEYTTVIERLWEFEQQASEATANRDAARQATIETMRRSGLSMRAIADALRLSHQRVSQLARAPQVPQN
ncbi:hypothetical protein A8924_6150 [Saccharopolyspora erythraea NRRL 2338]|uniref:Uncharacterized protein n=2 Tax=Saccharopolyspora erythraea TaxID=1836 RepID=A4FLR7_SACEN|nr:hypothetical protein [Saccharopolyspora erythraea]EQD88247.1 hypothetical protein N599_00100 [Saccharopolyspora erythraea D]PFG98629.1 hypothetical protein A8924_6150 [Saccharopolyspora erythraea NRRL 2338]QRK88659.1 MerR [Saccharopolyspora erythraea]CAM04992.1 hypothetical protein SACE_5808 [Saccharopolyspora erythraea NRRL 2338]